MKHNTLPAVDLSRSAAHATWGTGATDVIADIGLDHDGCMSDIVRLLGDVATITTGRDRAEFPPAEQWDFYHDWGLTLDEFLNLISTGIAEHDLFVQVPIFDEVIEGWSILRSLPVRIHILTDRGNDTTRQAAGEQTVRWFDRHGLTPDTLTMTGDKTKLRDVSITDRLFMLEDKPANFDACTAAGIETYMRDQLWNASHPVPADRRVSDFLHFAETVADALS
jgi:hypothetical protein